MLLVFLGMKTTTAIGMVLVAVLGAGAGGCASEEADIRSSLWTCQAARVPHGTTFECTAVVSSAATADGPSYSCAPVDAREQCPAADAIAAAGGAGGEASDQVASDGVSTSSGGAGGAAGSSGAAGEASGSVSSDGVSTSSGGAAAGGAGASGGATKASGGKTSGGATSGGATGGGTADGPSAAGQGAGGGDADAAIGSDGVTVGDGGFFCTFEVGVRTCRRAPDCDEGSHRVQMDCEPDQSSGLGSGGGAPSSSSGFPGGGTADGTLPGGKTECYYPVGAPAGTTTPAATFEYVLETVAGAKELHTRLTFNPAFVDNSYGVGSVGWGARVHKFRDLVGSDHAELAFRDPSGAEKLHFKLDYISASASAPSGYACLGVGGGEGRMILGAASSITKASSSLDRNLNERGHKQFLVDSPATNASYAAPAAAPDWDYRVVYEAWIKNEAFGAGGFGKVELSFVHASPSKASSNTLPVVPGPCPPEWAVR